MNFAVSDERIFLFWRLFSVKCNGHEACVARILRCTKAAGKAGENKTEQVFLVLMRLKCGDWKYAAMRHVEQLDPLEEYDLEAIASNAAALETALQNFEPVSVSKASKDAAIFAGSSGSRRSFRCVRWWATAPPPTRAPRTLATTARAARARRACSCRCASPAA